MEMASRSIDLISKKNTFFFKLAKEQLQVCTCSSLFLSFFAVVCTTTMPFCTTKASNFLCYTLLIFMEKLSYVLTKAFVSRVLVRFYFFTATHFTLLGSHFSFSHGTAAMKFSCFSSKESKFVSFAFDNSHSTSFSVIQVSVDVKNTMKKDTTLLLFFLSKSPGGHAISFQIKP